MRGYPGPPSSSFRSCGKEHTFFFHGCKKNVFFFYGYAVWEDLEKDWKIRLISCTAEKVKKEDFKVSYHVHNYVADLRNRGYWPTMYMMLEAMIALLSLPRFCSHNPSSSCAHTHTHAQKLKANNTTVCIYSKPFVTI